MPRISDSELNEMFGRANVNKDMLRDSLRKMGTKYLKNERMRKMWNPSIPTINYCYVVSEFVYWYALKDKQSRLLVMTTKIPSKPGITHWFLQYKRGNLIDLTADQFENWEEIDYADGASKRFFLQTGHTGPSKRAKILAELMGYNENSWATTVVL